MAQQKGPKKAVGEIGPTKITAGPDGHKAEIIHTDLPQQKEALETFFAEQFQADFNATRPLGQVVEIKSLVQNDTSDLDFKIDCGAAKYLELAELNPRSEPFGREMYRTGKFNVYEYAHWIYFRVIRKKQRSYGPDLSRNVILLVYVTHWQFLPSQSTFECVRSLCAKEGCDFVAVFVLLTDGQSLQHTEIVHPYSGPPLRKPSDFSGVACTNLSPGNHQWKVD